MSFASPHRDRSGPALPLAGMVDILFLLLVFFITTSSLRAQEALIDIEPAVSNAPSAGGAPGLVITATADNQLLFNGQKMELAEIAERLKQLSEQYPGQTVTYQPDRTSHVGLFSAVRDMAAEAGLDVRWAVARPESSGE